MKSQIIFSSHNLLQISYMKMHINKESKSKIRIFRTALLSICSFGIALLSFNPVCGQTKIDSLRLKIKNAPTDSLKAEAYIDLGFEYFFFSLDSLDKVIEAGNQSEKIAKNANVVSTLITAYNLKARAYREKGDYAKSENEMRQGIAIAKKNKLKKRMHQLEDNLANTLFDQDKKDEALKLKIKALEAFKEMGDSVSASITEFGLGFLYMETNQLEKAKERFFKSIDLDKGAASNIESYGNLGIIYENQNKLDSAIFYLELAAQNGRDYPSFMMLNQVSLAEVYRKKGDIQKALNMLLNVEDQFEENSEVGYFQYYKLLIAEYYTELNNWDRAKEYLQGIDTTIILGKSIYKGRFGEVGYTIFSKNQNYKEALRYYTYYRDAIDSFENARIDSNFKEIESKYLLSEKQATIGTQKLKIRNYSLGFVIALGLLTLGAVLFLGYRRKETLEKKIIKEKTEKQKIEIENLLKENKIISMQSMIEGQEEERKRIARDLHDNIGTLMSSIKMKVLAIQREVKSLEKMNIANELDGMIDNASQQVRRISYSMTPVALDISGLSHAINDLGTQLTQNNIELHANIKVLDQIEDKKLTINIYRILQEIIQNIIKHSQASEVSLDMAIIEETLVMRIRDNGVGLDEEKWDAAKSIGANNIKSRVNYLNGELKLITDIGTHFKISIPLH